MRHLIIFVLSPLFLFSQIQIGDDIDGVAAGDHSGVVSISSDGTIVAIGSPGNDDEGADAGLVRIFENSAGDWVQKGNTIHGDALGDHFGSSVSLSSDGLILAIGSPDAEIAGYVRIFEFNGSGIWTQIGDDLVGEAESGGFVDFRFGKSVSLSNDGSILAIAEDRVNFLDPQFEIPGFIHMFENNAGIWTQIGDSIQTSISNIINIALNGNGAIVAISGLGDWNWLFGYIGYAEVYESNAGIWVQVGNNFSWLRSCSLSHDGSKIAIGGSPTKIYEFINNDWEQIGEDIELENSFEFPGDINLSSNGSVVTLSGFDNTSSQTLFGFVRVYQNVSGTWIKRGNDILGEGLEDFYHNIDLSSDSNKISIGSMTNDGNGTDSGHVRVYSLNDLLSAEDYPYAHFELYPNPASDQFTIQLDKDSELKIVNIYSNLGQLIHTTSEIIVNISALSSGLYYVEVITNKGRATEKLILK